MRTSWIKELINNTGKSDDDFRREVDEKLNMNLFPELSEKLNPIIENFIPKPLNLTEYRKLFLPIN